MSEDFPIVITGQAAFGESVLKALLNAGEHIVGIFCPPEKEGGRPDPIKELALSKDIPVFQFKRMRDQDAIDAFISLNASLHVMAFVTDIVPDEIINAPLHGSIQYHPSLLPKHRGPSSINWPIIQGEEKTGLSIFWPDDGLDTGPILIQKEVEIKPDDTLGTIYFDQLFGMGVDAMVESVKLVKEGNAPKIEQDHSQMTYEGWCRPKDVIVDWSASGSDIYNLLRGSDPSPGAGSTFKGSSIQFYSTSKDSESSDEKPGTILELSDKGICVAVNHGRIWISKVKPANEKKCAASEWAHSNSVQLGDVFGE
jgi:methionyl-tRNA formyltransferase